MSYSPLVEFVRLSPNCTKPRKGRIDTITIHCTGGQCDIETLGKLFAPVSRRASSNYGVDRNGRIGCFVEEEDRSWCSGSAANDNRAITIEVSSDSSHPYAVTDAAYRSLIELTADICRRNGIEELRWQGDKSLIGQADKQNMTVHRWFEAKACPGDWLYSRHGEIAAAVNKKLREEEEDEDMVRYERLSDIPNEYGFRDIIEKLMDAKIINGDGSDPDGNNDVIDLSHDQVRSLIFEYRGGAFDRKLMAMGLEPAVEE